MQLAEIADRAKVRPVVADDRQKGQIAFAGQGDLAAGKHAHAVGIEQQADHHRRIEGRGASGFVLIGRIEAAQIQLRHGIEQEEDQVALGQLRRRAMRVLLIALGLPGTIRFLPALTHHHSPSVCGIEAAYTENGIIAWASPVRQRCFDKPNNLFRGQAPRRGLHHRVARDRALTLSWRAAWAAVSTAARWRAFETSDVAFLLQVLEHTMPTIENIRLVDRLAFDAAEVERRAYRP